MNVFLPGVPFSAAHMGILGFYSFNFALLVFRINSRMPHAEIATFWISLVFEVSKSVKMLKKNGNFSAEVT